MTHLSNIHTATELDAEAPARRDWVSIPEAERNEIVRQAKALNAEGMNWKAIGLLFRVSGMTVRMNCDPEYRAQRYSYKRELFRTGAIHPKNIGDPISVAEVERLKAQIPEDTRSLTAALMGDPLPGRRAIDRRVRASSPPSFQL